MVLKEDMDRKKNGDFSYLMVKIHNKFKLKSWSSKDLEGRKN